LEAGLRREQRLTAEIAHELRTPLSGIRAEAELGMAAGRSAEDPRESLATIVAEVDRMSSTIDALLRAAGRLGPDKATCDLAQAVTAAVQANAATGMDQGVAISVEEPFHSCRVAADAAFVTQLLNPLLENAVRHATTTACRPAASRSRWRRRVRTPERVVITDVTSDSFVAPLSRPPIVFRPQRRRRRRAAARHRPGLRKRRSGQPEEARRHRRLQGGRQRGGHRDLPRYVSGRRPPQRSGEGPAVIFSTS